MTIHWRTRLAVPALAAAVTVFAANASTREPTRQPAVQKPRTHALLVGVTRYPDLEPRDQLAGPVNDVALMRDALIRRGVDPKLIVELTEEKNRRRPTRAHIETEFVRLAREVGRGDQVVILFAGHGSQQPDTDAPGTDEEDMLDEIFLPADAGNWDRGVGEVRNAIKDDDIGKWLTDIRNSGAFVWAIFDACQSTTLTRGNFERQRTVPIERLVPKDVLERVRSGTRGGSSSESSMVGLKNEAGGIAALYAAQTIEPTPEKQLPENERGTGKVHGLFTYTMVEILNQSTTPLTYRDLAERILQRYDAMGRIGPTPGFEGGGLDTPVLGGENGWTGPRIVVEKTDKGLQLRPGSVAGLTRGTIVAVLPPAGTANADQPVGHLKITDVDPQSATFEPTAFGDLKPPDVSKLLPGSRARVVQFDYGDQVLRIAAAPGSHPAVDSALAAIAKETNGLATRAASIEAADWVIQVSGDDVVLAPASGWQVDPAAKQSEESQAPFVVGRVGSSTLTGDLVRVLNAVSRARNLMQLAAAESPGQGDSEVDVAVELVRFNGKQDPSGAVVPLGQGGRTLRVGDQVAFRLKNTGKATADVTLLFVDSKYGIQALYPPRDREVEARLRPGASITTSRFDVKDDTTGRERVVAIAVAASSVRADFRFLEQPTLVTTRAGEDPRAAMRGGPAGSLQMLLERSMYGVGKTRSLTASEVGNHAMKMLTWKTVKAGD